MAVSRRTKSATLALGRLTAKLGIELARPTYGSGYVLPSGVRTSSTVRALGDVVFLALEEHGLSQEEVRDTLRLTHISERGLPPHRYDLIRGVLTHD